MPRNKSPELLIRPTRGAPTAGSARALHASRPSPNAVERWRKLVAWNGTPELQMGLDGALLETATDAPVVRFYTWSPDTLSLGYFQRWADVPGTECAGAVARRITGGGAIHHRDELTFSIAAPLAHPLYRGPVADSYVRVHAAIARALADWGVDADARGTRQVASDAAGTGMCFHASTSLDLVWEGRKGVGSAQRRTGGRVLHHGSIKLGATELDRGVAAVQASPAELAERLESTFARAFGCHLETDEPRPAELELAAELGARATSAEFLHRR